MSSNSTSFGEFTYWWQRQDLKFDGDGTLVLAGHRLKDLASQTCKPSFFYSATRVLYKLKALHSALKATGIPFHIYYALKANRFTPLVTNMQRWQLNGLDVCSPAELEFALSCGFEESALSFTATSLSTTDLHILSRYKDVHINCDSLTTIRRLGELCPGRTIGIRVNPGKGVSYSDTEILKYSGKETTKFGIYREHFDDALQLAHQYNLTVDTIHFHVGIGYLGPQLELWDEIVGDCTWFTDRVEKLRKVNLGGGIGLPHVHTDKPLDLSLWAQVIKKHFTQRNVEIAIEPGDFIVKDSGVLVLQVNTVEKKQNTLFVGVNGGFNLAIEPFFYSLPCEPVPCAIDLESARAGYGDVLQKVTIAGNINEAHDLWARDVYLPRVEEGDFLAFINAGGYASSMSSNHCMRGDFYERMLFPSQ